MAENLALYGARRGVRLLPTSSTDRRDDFALSKTFQRGRVSVRPAAIWRMTGNIMLNLGRPHQFVVGSSNIPRNALAPLRAEQFLCGKAFAPSFYGSAPPSSFRRPHRVGLPREALTRLGAKA